MTTSRIGAALRQAVILVGGLGTRLGDLTKTMPKPLLQVMDQPFLDVLMWHLHRIGVRDVLLLAGFQADKVVDYAASTPFAHKMNITISVEPSPLGTGGALLAAADQLDEMFLLLNGDSIFDFNWLGLVDALADPSQPLIAMALRPINDASRYGVVKLANQHVTKFEERGDASGGLVNGGVYLARREILEHISAPCSLERDVLPMLAAQRKITGIERDGFFLDIGIPTDYHRATNLIAQSLRRPAIFFDRDGVLNLDHGYVGTIDRFDWNDGAIAAIKEVNEAGFFAFIVTNQAGVARGLYSEGDVVALHSVISEQLRLQGAHIDDIRYCPYHPDGIIDGYRQHSDWRKPAPGMLLDLMAAWPVEKTGSWIIGDKESDIEAGYRAGIEGVLYRAGEDLLETIRRMIRR